MGKIKPESEFNMIDWWKKVNLKNYANFNGRARRAEYWWTYLLNFIIAFGLSFLGGILGATVGSEAGLIFTIPYYIFAFGTLIPSLAVGVRRLHDSGKSGWFLLIPIYNLILLVTEGDKGKNEYGSDPKSLGNDEIDQIGSTSNY